MQSATAAVTRQPALQKEAVWLGAEMAPVRLCGHDGSYQTAGWLRRDVLETGRWGMPAKYPALHGALKKN